MTDMSELASWAKENNKTLAFCSGPSGGALVLDMSSENPVAELIAQVLAFAAQMEAFNDRERALGAREYLRQVRRYAGGWTSFGYSPASLGKGKALHWSQTSMRQSPSAWQKTSSRAMGQATLPGG